MAKEEAKTEVKEEKKTVTIHLIPAEWDDAEFEVFGINGKIWQINTGEDVEVPPELAESIKCVKAARVEKQKRAKGKKK